MTDELLRDFYRGNLGGPDTDDGSMLQETPDDSLGEAFSSGLVAGVEGLGTSLDYFQALIGTAIGDDQMAEDNIAEAKVGEAISVGAMSGIQEFGEFLENPSVTGALTQVASFGGQGVPSLIYSIGSLATGGIGGAAVGVAVQVARKKAASRLVKDLLEDVTKGKGSKKDLADAQAIYDHAKSEAKRQGAKYGAYTGAAASEYPSLAGENFGEALGAGQERDRSTAFRAAAVAVPQTAIGVGTEAAFLKAIQRQATKRSTGEGSVFGKLAKGLGGGAALEGFSEYAQSEIAIQNRSDYDPTYTQEEKNLRRMESAFAGAVVGGFAGGAGSVGSTLYQKRTSATEMAGKVGSGTAEKTQAIFAKARGMWADSVGKRENDKSDAEESGEQQAAPAEQPDATTSKNASPEQLDLSLGEQADTAAEMQNTLDDYDSFLQANQTEEPTRRSMETFTPADPDDLDETLVSESSRKDLRTFPRSTEPAAKERPDLESAREEFRTKIGDNLATLAAEDPSNERLVALEKQFREGDNARKDEIMSTLQAERRQLENDQPLGEGIDIVQEFFSRTAEGIDKSKSYVDALGQGFTENVETVATKGYSRKKDPTKTYKNTEESRAQFEEAFGETDWTSPFYGGMTEAFLRRAAKTVQDDRNSEGEAQSDFDIQNTAKGYVLRKTSFIKDRDEVDDQFIRGTIAGAKRSQYAAGSNVQIVEAGLEPRDVNLADLTDAGRSLIQDRGNDTYQGDRLTEMSQRGLSEFVSELAELNAQASEKGAPTFDLLIAGKSIFDLTPQDLSGPAGDVNAARVADADITLRELLSTDEDGGSFVEVKYVQYDENNVPQTRFVRSSGGQRLTAATARVEIDKLKKRGYKPELVLSPKEFKRPAVVDEEAELLADEEEFRNTDWADQGGESERFQRDSFDRNGLDSTPDPEMPKSRLNIEMNPRDQDRSRVGSSKPLNIDYPFGKPSEMVAEFLDKAIRKIKPTKPVYVIGLKQLQGMRKDRVSARSVSARQDASQTSRRDQMRARFNDDRVADLVAEAADELANNPNKHGEYIGFTNAHIALVDDLNTTNDVEASLVSAHEAIGHVLFNEEIEATLANPVLRQRLERDFEKARRAEKAPWQYQTEHGFEEWFADQTATYALKVYVQGKKPSSGIVSKTFQKIVEKLKRLFQDLSTEFKKRFGKDSYSATFDDYIQNVIVAERANLRRTQRIFPAEVSYKKKAIVRAMEESVNKAPDGPAAVNAMKRNFKQHIDGTATGHTMFKLVLPEDNMLRSISPVIADMMYVRSNSESLGNNQHGFMNSKDHVRSQVYDQLEKMLGTDWETKEVTDAFELAADQTTKTEDLDGKAREIRDWLSDLHDNYISKTPGNTIEKRPDYFPIALNLAAIYTDDAAFAELVLEFNPLLNPEKVRQTVDGLIARQQHVLDDDEVTFKATDPVSVVEQARVLTENIPHDRLKPFIEAPEAALLKYIRHVITRSEWKRSTHDDAGKDLLALELVKLPEAKRKEAVATLERYLGYTKSPLNPTLSKAMSWMQLFNWVTLLPMATIGSIPELGGAIVNTREFAGFGMAKNAILSRMQNPEQAIQLARTIGVTHSTVMGNLGLTEADAEYLDPRVRKYSDKFFSVIGLDWFTRYTREFASVLSVDFLVEHAFNKNKNPRAERYLSIHGVTADQVKSWHARQEDGGHYTFDGDDGAAVMSAMQRFVSNSMLKPNAAERTSWGNDPKYQLIWALKSYLMSFGKVILGGVKREMATRLAEGDTTFEKLSSVGMMGVLTLAAFMPLAALSLELREIAKAGLAGVLPGVDVRAYCQE